MSGKNFVFVLFTVISMSVAEPIVIQLQVQDPSSSLNDAIYYSQSPLSEIVPKLDSTTTIKSTIATPITSTIKTTTSYSPSSYTTSGVANWLSSNADGSKFVGGDPAMPNEFPWMALVQIEMTNSQIFYCGGTLIADRWILTAARCLLVSGQTLKSVGVYLGVHDILASYEANRKLYSGSQVLFHPDYNANNQAGDIALIQLSTIVTYTQFIRPVYLATPNEPNYINSQVTVTGWGTTYDDSAINPFFFSLRKVTVPVISNAECSSTYGSTVVTDKIICISGANSLGICAGDAGGGPMNFKQSDGTWKQIGIASFTSTAGCTSGQPSGYTRLSSYSTWIQSVMSSNNGSPSTTMANLSFAFLSSVLVSISFVF